MTPKRVEQRGKVIGMPKEISETLSIAQLDETGHVLEHERNGKPVSVVTRMLKNAIRGRIRKNPERYIKKIDYELLCSEKSVTNAIKGYEMYLCWLVKEVSLNRRK